MARQRAVLADPARGALAVRPSAVRGHDRHRGGHRRQAPQRRRTPAGARRLRARRDPARVVEQLGDVHRRRRVLGRLRLIVAPLFAGMIGIVIWQRRRERAVLAGQMPGFARRGGSRPARSAAFQPRRAAGLAHRGAPAVRAGGREGRRPVPAGGHRAGVPARPQSAGRHRADGAAVDTPQPSPRSSGPGGRANRAPGALPVALRHHGRSRRLAPPPQVPPSPRRGRPRPTSPRRAGRTTSPPPPMTTRPPHGSRSGWSPPGASARWSARRSRSGPPGRRRLRGVARVGAPGLGVLPACRCCLPTRSCAGRPRAARGTRRRAPRPGPGPRGGGEMPAGQIVVHTSGAPGVGVLAPAAEQGVLPLALHPVMTITGRVEDVTTGCAARAPGGPAGAEAAGWPVGEALVVEMGAEPGAHPRGRPPAVPRRAGARGESPGHARRARASTARRRGRGEPAERVVAPLLSAALDNALRPATARSPGRWRAATRARSPPTSGDHRRPTPDRRRLPGLARRPPTAPRRRTAPEDAAKDAARPALADDP